MFSLYRTGSVMGRTSSYSDAIADEFIERLSCGESMRGICEDTHMPSRPTLWKWMDADASFLDRYIRARDRQAHSYADLALQMAEGRNKHEDPGALRVQLDAIKWAASKLAPRVYGEKLDLLYSGTITVVPVDYSKVTDDEPEPEPEGSKQKLLTVEPSDYVVVAD